MPDIYLRTLTGLYVGHQPGTATVYQDRKAANGWERLRQTTQSDGRTVLTFVESGAVLSCQPDGALQTRPAGSAGPFEVWTLAQQPPGWGVTLAFVEFDPKDWPQAKTRVPQVWLLEVAK